MTTAEQIRSQNKARAWNFFHALALWRKEHDMGWLLAALLSGVFAFNSAVTPDKAAQKAEEALERRFPGAQIDVDIEGKRGADVLNGKFKRVRIEMANFTLSDLPFESATSNSKGTAKRESKLGHAGEIDLVLKNVVWRDVPVEAAKFELRDVDYDLGALKSSQLSFARMGAAKAKVDLQAAGLGKVVATRLNDVTEASVQLRNGKFLVSGKRNVLGLGAPFRLTATPQANGASIELRDAKVSMGVVPVPGFVVGTLLGKVNPIYSFDTEEQWPFAFSDRQIDAQNDRLHIEADLKLK